MDLNIKIIEGVKQFPVLYDNCGDLDERNHAWMQLAEKLDMRVQILQIRWHALLQLYNRDNNFKYSNRMQFIYRSVEKQIKVDNWPEFVITDEYLKSYNNEDQEEFVYLETEEENNSQSQISSKENDTTYDEVTQENDVGNRKDDGPAEGKVTKEVNRLGEQTQQQDDDIEINSGRKSKEPANSSNTPIEETEKITAVDRNKNYSNTSFETPKQKSPEKPQSFIGERCEDVIFGELVSAMLKRMDENKKKSIKKEIMNLLFS